MVNGLITGWHEPGASHLALLKAVAGADLVPPPTGPPQAGYLWHEFGDSRLLLPPSARAPGRRAPRARQAA